MGFAEILVLLAIGALLFAALTPFRRWVERTYVRAHRRSGGVVIPMRRRADGSYGPVDGDRGEPKRRAEEEGDETER